MNSRNSLLRSPRKLKLRSRKKRPKPVQNLRVKRQNNQVIKICWQSKSHQWLLWIQITKWILIVQLLSPPSNTYHKEDIIQLGAITKASIKSLSSICNNPVSNQLSSILTDLIFPILSHYNSQMIWKSWQVKIYIICTNSLSFNQAKMVRCQISNSIRPHRAIIACSMLRTTYKCLRLTRSKWRIPILMKIEIPGKTPNLKSITIVINSNKTIPNSSLVLKTISRRSNLKIRTRKVIMANSITQRRRSSTPMPVPSLPTNMDQSKPMSTKTNWMLKRSFWVTKSTTLCYMAHSSKTWWIMRITKTLVCMTMISQTCSATTKVEWAGWTNWTRILRSIKCIIKPNNRPTWYTCRDSPHSNGNQIQSLIQNTKTSFSINSSREMSTIRWVKLRKYKFWTRPKIFRTASRTLLIMQRMLVEINRKKTPISKRYQVLKLNQHQIKKLQPRAASISRHLELMEVSYDHQMWYKLDLMVEISSKINFWSHHRKLSKWLDKWVSIIKWIHIILTNLATWTWDRSKTITMRTQTACRICTICHKFRTCKIYKANLPICLI